MDDREHPRRLRRGLPTLGSALGRGSADRVADPSAQHPRQSDHEPGLDQRGEDKGVRPHSIRDPGDRHCDPNPGGASAGADTQPTQVQAHNPIAAAGLEGQQQRKP